MIYKLDALDTLTFRTANPFDAGVNFHAHSQFPPLPSVYAGALRQGENIKPQQIKIGFSGVLLNHEFAFPQPLDTLITNEGDANELTAMSLIKKRHSNHELDWMLAPAKEIEKKISVSGGAYIKQENLQQYLNGDQTIEYEKLGDYFKRESHIGIEMNQSSHATKEGMWYSTELIRPKQCSLVVEATGIELEKDAAVKIGGNTKLAYVKEVEEPFTIPAPKVNNRYFKLYFATPSIFKYGWLPRWIDPKTKEGEFSFRKRKVKVRLVAAAIDKPIPVGGYSEKGPRPMRMAVPAGSVYYFELLDDSSYEDAVKLFHQKCLSDYRETLDFDYSWWNRLIYCDRGFGYAFVGNVKEEQFNE